MLAALPNTVYVKQHVGPPGSAGTGNPSAVTTRQSATLGTASGGARALTTTPVFTETATETETHVSLWDASTSGNFLVSGILTTPQSEQSGYTFTLNALTVSLTGSLAS
jgi:hypothetical protein